MSSSRSNLIASYCGLMPLHHRRSNIYFILFLLLAAFTTSILALYFLRATYILGVQITVAKYRTHCETVHIASVVGGENHSRYYTTLVKSILSKTQNPLHFHLITDKRSHQILKTLFATWDLPSATVSFYDIAAHLHRVDWIPNTHYSGNYGLMKLLVPEILPNEVEKVIVLDTDLVVLTDIIELWGHLNFMASHEFLGMVDNLSGWYTQNVTSPKWPALGNGYNSGVILMDLKGLRKADFANRWREAATESLLTTGKTLLADQDILNAHITRSPEIVYPLSYEYNVQVGLRSSLTEEQVEHAKIIHWNNKDKSLNIYPEMLKLRDSLEDMDGSVFEQTRFLCRHIFFGHLLAKSQKDGCESYKPLPVYRTHLFLLPYSKKNNSKVTLVTQMSTDRLTMFDSLLSSWAADISVAVYGSDKEINSIWKYILLKYPNRRNIALHGVYSQGQLFPTNYLRNTALNACETEFVFIIDVDFVVYQEKQLTSSVNNLPPQSVLVTPAFEFTETMYENGLPALNKSRIVRLLETQKITPFRNNIWPKGHQATQFAIWINASEPFQIEWEPDFEPYLIGRKSEIPRFDERFGGFGWNKVTHAYQIKMQRLQFLVHPKAFVIHRYHPPSNELAKYRYSALYKRCMLRLKRDFVTDLLWANSEHKRQ